MTSYCGGSCGTCTGSETCNNNGMCTSGGSSCTVKYECQGSFTDGYRFSKTNSDCSVTNYFGVCPTGTACGTGGEASTIASLCTLNACEKTVCLDIQNRQCIDTSGAPGSIIPCDTGLECSVVDSSTSICKTTGSQETVLNPLTDIIIKNTNLGIAEGKIIVDATFTSTKTGTAIIEAGSNKQTSPQAIVNTINSNYCNPGENWYANQKVLLNSGTDYVAKFELSPKDGIGPYTVSITACDKCKNVGEPTCTPAVTGTITVTNNVKCTEDLTTTCDDASTITLANCVNGVYVYTNNKCSGTTTDICDTISQFNLFKMDNSCTGGWVVIFLAIVLLIIVWSFASNPPSGGGRRRR